jgi:hypothetical protein
MTNEQAEIIAEALTRIADAITELASALDGPIMLDFADELFVNLKKD